MNLKLTLSAALLAVLAPVGVFAQGPDGSDINKAIPAFFGQTIEDIVDSATRPKLVYSITLARGQQFSVTATGVSFANQAWAICLYAPNERSVGADQQGCPASPLAVRGWAREPFFTINYQVPTAGTYYFVVTSRDPGLKFKFVATAQGTPIAVPNPPTAGCLNGRVDYITYSLQLIAVGLADEVSIGGSKICASCAVKAPLYPEIVNRLESALKSKVNVETCYDAAGSIFQIKMIQP